MLPPVSEDDVLREASRMLETRVIKFVCLVNTGAASGTLGFDHAKDLLIGFGVNPSSIIGIPYMYEEGHINTLFEAESFANFIETMSLTCVSVLCQPYHLPRSIITLISSLERRDIHIKVKSFSAPVTSWTDHIVHSQGKLSGKRFELIDSEDKRIKLYQRKGDLLSEIEVLEYLGYI